MPRRFAPVPSEATAAFEIGQYHCLLDLWDRAHNSRWRPIRYTERQLAKRWKVSRRQLRLILDTLVDLELITLEKCESNGSSRIHVLDVTRKEAKNADRDLEVAVQGQGPAPDPLVDRVPDRDDSGSTDDTEGADPAGGPRTGPQGEPRTGPRTGPLYRDLRTENEPKNEKRETRNETEAEVSAPPTASQLTLAGGPSPDDPQASPPPKTAALPALNKLSGKRTAALRIFDHWHSHHSGTSEIPSDDERDKIVKAIERRARALKGKRHRYTPEDWSTAEQDLRDLIDWFHTAPAAAYWQGANANDRKHLGITPIFKRDKHGDRINDMVEWRDGGRPVSTGPPTAGRGGANRHVFGAPPRERDWIEAEVIERNPTQGGQHGR